MPTSSARSPAGSSRSSRRSRARSARSASACELTETYSPAAIEAAPATSPAMPAVRIAERLEFAAATPTMIAATETMPSLAPSTAARSQPARWLRCSSLWRRCREVRTPVILGFAYAGVGVGTVPVMLLYHVHFDVADVPTLERRYVSDGFDVVARYGYLGREHQAF